MCQKEDNLQKDNDLNKILPQIRRVIRDADQKDEHSNEPNYRKDSCTRVKFAKEADHHNVDCQPEDKHEEKYRQDSCSRLQLRKEAKHQNVDCQQEQKFSPQDRKQQDACLSTCQKREVEMMAKVSDTQPMDCQYPTEHRMVRPLITYNGLTDIRYTTDKDKVIHESGVGVQYRLINVVPEIEAPWCKRNGLQDYWMEDPKYARKSVDIYSTPYPCCQHPMRTNRSAAPAQPQQPQPQPQGWDCCKGKSNGPQANCNDKRNGKGRFRDIAPVMPREQEFDWKENCNIK